MEPIASPGCATVPAVFAASGKGGAGYSSSGGGAAASAALLAAASGPQLEPWVKLPGLAEVLAVMEAAVSQNIYLPQLLLYRCAWMLQISTFCKQQCEFAASSANRTGKAELHLAVSQTLGVLSGRYWVNELLSRPATTTASGQKA